MDEAEGGDRCTNPPTQLTLFSLHSCFRVVVLLYGVRQTNRIGLPRVFRCSMEKGDAAVLLPEISPTPYKLRGLVTTFQCRGSL
jgi:hypothetical protein